MVIFSMTNKELFVQPTDSFAHL